MKTLNPRARAAKSCSNLDVLAARRPPGDGREARAHDRLVAGLAALAQTPLPAVDEAAVLRRLEARRRREAVLRRRVVDRFVLAGTGSRFAFLGGGNGFALPASVAFLIVWMLVVVSDARAVRTAPAIRSGPAVIAAWTPPHALLDDFRRRDQKAAPTRNW